MNLVLITGFLGSGKTTFLSNLLRDFKNQRIGVIMNEFGKKGIDGTLIKNDYFNMIELNNGSIFCSCIKDNFIQAIVEFTKYDVNYLFVESSGLADPSNMENILNVVTKLSNKKVRYLGAICIIDAEYFLKHYKILPALSRQIKYSDSVIINKIDLQTRENINTIEQEIIRINKNSNIYKTKFCNIEIDNIISNLRHTNKGSSQTTNTKDTRPISIIISVNEPVNRETFTEFLKNICLDAYRIKGFVSTTKGTYEVSAVGKHLSLKKWNKVKKDTEIVIISSIGIKIISKVTREWNNLFSSKLTITS